MPDNREAIVRSLKNDGFTLIEMLVVMVLIAMLAGIVGPRLFQKVGSSKIKVANAQIELLASALETYRLDVGRFPTSEQGLNALRVEPEGIKNWDATVRDMVIGRKTADVLSLTAAGHESLTVPMRIQTSSMVRFMVGTGPDRFAKMVRLLYGSREEQSVVLAIKGAVRSAYGVDLRTLEKAWRLWAGRKR